MTVGSASRLYRLNNIVTGKRIGSTTADTQSAQSAQRAAQPAVDIVVERSAKPRRRLSDIFAAIFRNADGDRVEISKKAMELWLNHVNEAEQVREAEQE